MTARVTRPSASQVVQELTIAQGRIVRLTATHGSTAITLQEIYAYFTEGGISQSGSIQPSPPLTIAAMPLRTGRWSGSFTDGSSRGNYTFALTRFETISAADAQRRAGRLEGTITIDGEQSGTVNLTVWIDPETSTFLRLQAAVDLRYSLGTYKAHFIDTLSRGPGF